MPDIDPKSALIVAILMMLSNGGLLGVMQGDLPKSLRPSAMSWQAGTVLIAAGAVFFASVGYLPQTLLVTVANGFVLLGFTAYWHSLRELYGYRPNAWLLLPAVLGTLGVFAFSYFSSRPIVRIEIITLAWFFIFASTARILKSQALTDTALSRRVLLVIYLFLMAFVVVRGLYYLPLQASSDFIATDTTNWMNKATILLTISLPITGTTAFVLICSERIGRQWELAATTDYLTGLANRRTLTEAGARLASARDTQAGLALAMIDIDRFKSVNDAHGHAVGDAVLKHVADRLNAVTRGSEMLARIGGEEFVVLLNGIENAEQAQAAGERLRLAVQNHPFVDGPRHLPVTLSIGVARACASDGDFDTLLRAADRALYAAKEGGRNRVVVAADHAAVDELLTRHST